MTLVATRRKTRRAKGLAGAALLLGLTLFASAGCAVYEPAPAYYSGPYYAYPASPCCTTLEFDYRSGGGHYHRDHDHDHGWHHWH